MSDTVIKVENLSKKYILSHQSQEKYTALRDVMANGAKRLGNKIISPFTLHLSQDSLTASQEDFYALRDVSFEIKQGDRVGIIGRNGAGKSTLLKILSRITEPTSGKIEITGRVASLLEVGTGFHPELTGRENIYLNGAILGMGKAEIKRKFDEIVAFAEVERFLDTPVKRYSSGMYVRLAFAVAAHLEPEILIVDEVLAVGDAQFQKKCLGKMEEVGKEGRTVIFVSHNMGAIANLCTKGILLDKGNLRLAGNAAEVINFYTEYGMQVSSEVAWGSQKTAPGDDVVRLASVRLLSDGETTSMPSIDRAIVLETTYWNLKPGKTLCVSFHLYDRYGNCAFAAGNLPAGTLEEDEWGGKQHPVGLYCATCTIPANFLNDGLYSVTLILLSEVTVIHLFIKDLIIFEVQDTAKREYLGEIIGAVRPKLGWKTVQQSGDSL